jgi:parvulin-like peptidyl-prolyl isomerase
MPETGSIAIQLGDRKVEREDLERKLRRMQLQMQAIGAPPSFGRKDVLSEIVGQLVDELALERVAATLGAVADPREVDARVKEIEDRAEQDPKFELFLAQAGNTHEQRVEDSRRHALENAVREKLAQRLQGQTEQAAKEYYRTHRNDFTDHGGREVWRIVIKASAMESDREIARRRVDDIVKRAKKNPASFPTLAETYSEGGKAAEGGYLGFVPKGTLEPKLEERIFDAKKDAIIGPEEDGIGYSIYRVGRSKLPRALPFEEVKEEIFRRTQLPLLGREMEKELKKAKSEVPLTIRIPELDRS